MSTIPNFVRQVLLPVILFGVAEGHGVLLMKMKKSEADRLLSPESEDGTGARPDEIEPTQKRKLSGGAVQALRLFAERLEKGDSKKTRATQVHTAPVKAMTRSGRQTPRIEQLIRNVFISNRWKTLSEPEMDPRALADGATKLASYRREKDGPWCIVLSTPNNPEPNTNRILKFPADQHDRFRETFSDIIREKPQLGSPGSPTPAVIERESRVFFDEYMGRVRYDGHVTGITEVGKAEVVVDQVWRRDDFRAQLPAAKGGKREVEVFDLSVKNGEQHEGYGRLT